MTENNQQGIGTWLTGLGTMRVAMYLVVLVLTLAAPFGGGQARYEGLPFVLSVLAPSLVVMFAFIVALDMLMTRVFMSDSEGSQLARYRQILWIEGLGLAAMLGAWSPLLVRLLSRS